MNVFFKVNEYVERDLNYDVGSGQLPEQYANIKAGNFRLDITAQIDESPEEAVIINLVSSGSANVKLVFISLPISSHLIISKQIHKPAAVTRSNRATAYLSPLSKSQLLYASAHEIGHMDVGVGKGLWHPRERGKKTNFDGFPLMRSGDDFKRLMWWQAKTNAPGEEHPSALLIKDEWMQFRTGL